MRGAGLLAACALTHSSLHDVPAPRSRVYEPADGEKERARARVDGLKVLYERDKRWSRRSRAT
jgi:hypothetical protein